MHSHILPGLDDGAEDWDEFSAMAAIAVSEGITHMVCTPHFISYEEEFSPDSYKLLLDEARINLASRGINLKLISGCEVFFTSDLELCLQERKIITLNDSGRYLLVEFSRLDVPASTKDVFFSLKLKGITPIIAHPERNIVFAQRPELLKELIEHGALCQLNTGSLTGMFGEYTKGAAEYLLKSQMIHILGSDAHSSGGRAPKFQKALHLIEKLVGPKMLTEITGDNPLKILNGEEVEPYPVKLSMILFTIKSELFYGEVVFSGTKC